MGEGVFHRPVPQPDEPIGGLLKFPVPDDCADADDPHNRKATASTVAHRCADPCIVLSPV